VTSLLRRLRRHLRPSPADVARTEALLDALAIQAQIDPDGFERALFLASDTPKAGG
jgi:hypothetical protein